MEKTNGESTEGSRNRFKVNREFGLDSSTNLGNRRLMEVRIRGGGVGGGNVQRRNQTKGSMTVNYGFHV